LSRPTAKGCPGFVRRFAVGDRVVTTLMQVFERWDGKGAPRGLAGDAIDLGARIFVLAEQAEMRMDSYVRSWTP
jgi:HD domain-containing protein